MSKEALKLALEALLNWKAAYPDEFDLFDEQAITALRGALAELQEKYIYGTPLLDAMTGKANEALDKMAENARELGLDYEPAQRQDMPKIGCVNHDCDKCKAQQQEPVARCMEHGECFGGECIYTSPPASKPWLGLTDEEIIDHFRTNVGTGSLLSFADGVRYAEAKLREKNA